MKLLEPPVWDEQWQGMEVARHGGWRYLWLWYGFNIRLLAVHDGPATAENWGVPYAWCYERGEGPGAVCEALRAWDPDTQDEPPGYKKRAADARLAPSRDPHDAYNRPRCEHGAYMDDDTCRLLVCTTTLNYRRTRGLPVRPIGVRP